MKYRLYTTSHKAWDGMFKAIEKAKKSVYLEMYILHNDTEKTHNFFALLKEKAEAGVEVIVIADSYGSSELDSHLVKDLRQSGAEFIFFSHWLRRTHRKILIVDKKIAFLGGVNIKENSRNWKDLQIRVEGSSANLLMKSFANAYRLSGGKKESIIRQGYTPLSKKIKSLIFDNWPTTNKLYSLSSYYKKKISQAEKLIQIVTPYLSPPRWLLAVLDDACRRGVTVEMIIPKYTDNKILDRMNYINACRLSNLGVKFFFIREMNHAKLMMIDNEEVAIGSQNIDVLSFKFNYEAGIFSRQKDLVEDVVEIIKRWKQEADEFKGSTKDLSFFDRVLSRFYKIFFPLF